MDSNLSSEVVQQTTSYPSRANFRAAGRPTYCINVNVFKHTQSTNVFLRGYNLV